MSLKEKYSGGWLTRILSIFMVYSLWNNEYGIMNSKKRVSW